MAEYKLKHALPQSAPGNTEFHYGYKCEVRQDGIYVELDEISAENFVNSGRVDGPVKKSAPLKETPKQAPVVEEKPSEVEVVEEKPQIKRGPKPKEQ